MGTGPGVPTHGHQHVPLEGVRELPLNEHLQAEGCAGSCQEPGPPPVSRPVYEGLRAPPHLSGTQPLTPPAGERGETGG